MLFIETFFVRVFQCSKCFREDLMYLYINLHDKNSTLLFLNNAFYYAIID